MKPYAILLSTLVLATLGTTGCASQNAHFGDAMRIDASETVPVADVLMGADKYNGKFIRVSGVVDDVCKSMGCWITLGAERGGETMRIKFTCPGEEGGRIIPMAAIGHEAIVEGTLEVASISEEEARHLAEESKMPAADVAKITGPQKTVRMTSPCVTIKGIKSGASGS
jgi:hypothetical protein